MVGGHRYPLNAEVCARNRLFERPRKCPYCEEMRWTQNRLDSHKSRCQQLQQRQRRRAQLR